jgi:hypothetical protein
MIARDLYRLQRHVDLLESRLQAASPSMREELEEELRKTKAERDRVKRMLEGTKEAPPYRKAK